MFGTRTFLKYFDLRYSLALTTFKNDVLTYKKDDTETTINSHQLIMVASYAIFDLCTFSALLYFSTKLSAEHTFDALQQQIILYVTCLLLAVIVSIHGILMHII